MHGCDDSGVVEMLHFNINCDIGHHSVDSKSHVESATMAIPFTVDLPN